MCGIFGQINFKRSTFNKTIFNTLGIANDTRGGDSCGIFVDKQVEYGVNNKKLYQNFFLDSEILKKTKECKIAFGHCRKTSVGKTSLETAQPVVIKEGDEIKYVLMHNGTIYNYEALAKKYIPDIDIKGMSDSQVMARIFYYKGYDALSEYNGGAVFVIADYRDNPDNPRVLIWKGESKQSNYQKQVTEERPFYYIKTKSSIYFSSIATFLEGFINDVCWTIQSNSLLEFIGDDLYIVKNYSRANAQQIKEFYSSSNNNNNKSSNNTDSGYSKSLYYIYHNQFGDYMLKGKKLHGKFFCSAYGSCWNEAYSSNQAQNFWFYNGILLHNEDCFNLIEIVRKELEKTNPEYSDVNAFCRDYAEIPSYFSYVPIKAYEGPDYFYITEDLLWEKFTGKFTDVLVNNNHNTCENGKITNFVKWTSIEGYNEFVEKAKTYYINKESFINVVNQTYNVSIRL